MVVSPLPHSELSSPEIEYFETPVFSPPRLSRTPSTNATTPATIGTPWALKSRPTTLSLLSAVDFRLSNPYALLEKHEVTISYQDIRWDIRLLSDERDVVLPHIEPFIKRLSKKESDEPSPISSTILLASALLGYLSKPGRPADALEIVLKVFERHFLLDEDIHSLALKLDNAGQVNLLKTYYAALERADYPSSSAKSALFEAAQNGDAHLYAFFGGQGPVNASCLQDLSQLYSTYGVFLDELLDVGAQTLERLASSGRAADFYAKTGFDIRKWIAQPETMPGPSTLASAPFSFPIIGLLSLAHYCIACKALGRHPGQVRDSMQGVSGHSQGIVVAAGIARSGSWKEFYESVDSVVEMLFWIGFESHAATPSSTLTAAESKESLRSGELQPSVMLGVRGLDLNTVQRLVGEVNVKLPGKDHIYLALINSRDNLVVSGPQSSLRQLCIILRKLKTEKRANNTPIQNRYLPISAPFHSPHLAGAVERVLEALDPSSFSEGYLSIGLYHTQTGEDLRNKPHSLKRSLVKMIMTDLVDWPRASNFPTASHILDFGPGRIGVLQNQLVEGTGTRVMIASDLRPYSEDVGSKADLFSSILPPQSVNWRQAFGPKLAKNSNGEPTIQTKMSRLLGVPPIMVEGVSGNPDFVAAVIISGYHAELAAEYYNAADFEKAIEDLAEKIPARRGITCNLASSTTENLSWQMPLIGGMVQRGLPIHSVTLGTELLTQDAIAGYVENSGLKYISFKPDSTKSIVEIVRRAKENPLFVFGIQWTGGKGGNYRSFEEYHEPIIKTYGQIRGCSNVVLTIGTGFGGANDTYPYLTGEWSEALGYARMPFDGVMLGDRMLVAKESGISAEVKELIVDADGSPDDEYHITYETPIGGIITINNEAGQPTNVVATRGARLWKDLDRTVFSKEPAKQKVELERQREDIIRKINKDFQKSWFAVDWMGGNVEIENMTYLEVFHRLFSLLYIRSQRRWIDKSYERLVLDFVARAQEGLVMLAPFDTPEHLDNPYDFLSDFTMCYPTAEDQRLETEDVDYFIALCSRSGQKPVNFIPRLDENFETWFKADAFWQAGNIEAVAQKDVDRIIIPLSPVAARESERLDESCKDILDRIVSSHTGKLRRDLRYSTSGASGIWSPAHLENISIADYPGQRVYIISQEWDAPNREVLIRHLPGSRPGWAQACLWDNSILQGTKRQKNPIRAAFNPQPGDTVDVKYGANGEIKSIMLNSHRNLSNQSKTLLSISSHDGTQISVKLYAPSAAGDRDNVLEFRFQYVEEGSCKLVENMSERTERTKSFYSNIWLNQSPSNFADFEIDSTFSGGRVSVTSEMVQAYLASLGRSHNGSEDTVGDAIPLDLCSVIGWDALIKPLLIPEMDGDHLSIVQRSNEFKYYPGVEPIAVGDVLYTTSYIEAITIEEAGKVIQVVAQIRRHETPVVKVTSTCVFQGSFTSFDDTFRSTSEPEMEIIVESAEIRDRILSNDWLEVGGSSELLNTTLVFRLRTVATYDASGAFTSLQTAGQAYTRSPAGVMAKFGRVCYESGPCKTNAVLAFLESAGTPSKRRTSVSTPTKWNATVRLPQEIYNYARVSKDVNPVHVSRVFAHYTHRPAAPVHSTHVSAAVRGAVEEAVAKGDASRFRRWAATFKESVLPGEELRVEIQHIAMLAGKMVLAVQAWDEKEKLVLEAEAEVENAMSTVSSHESLVIV